MITKHLVGRGATSGIQEGEGQNAVPALPSDHLQTAGALLDMPALETH